MFRGTSQDSQETVDQYCTKLRKLAADCRFHDKDAEIKSQILGHCQSDSLRRRALRTPNLSLSDLLTMARTLEKSELQASDMEKTHSNNCASVKSLSLRKPNTRQPNTNVKKHQTQGHRRPQGQTRNHNNYQRQTRYQTKHEACQNCGGDWPHWGGEDKDVRPKVRYVTRVPSQIIMPSAVAHAQEVN